jgi:GLE1-like protein
MIVVTQWLHESLISNWLIQKAVSLPFTLPLFGGEGALGLEVVLKPRGQLQIPGDRVLPGPLEMQVMAKASALTKYLQGLNGPAQTYAYLALSSRLASQCECQVSLNPAFAFPLAEVTVAVLKSHARFGALLLAKLQQVSASAVAPGLVLALERAYEHVESTELQVPAVLEPPG